MESAARKIASDNEKHRHSFVGVKGDLRVELHYIKIQGNEDRMAALYIHKFNNYDGGVFIPFADLYRYADPMLTKHGVPSLVKKLATHLYGIETESDENRVMDALFDYATDLKDHRPPPDWEKTMGDFLEECDKLDMEFFVEDGAGRRISLT